MEFLRLSQSARLPERAHQGDAGLDLFSPVEIILTPLQRKLVKLGFAVAIPEGFVGMVCPRSGLAANNGITVLNAPGIIDSGYRGEVGVVLVNVSNENVTIAQDSKIAQLLIVPCSLENPQWVGYLDDTDRGAGGFGSTGI
ncbi:MAG: dUTP diphosphatase [Caldisericia bacterium]|nr:dUTP diphosphatase [Caldisericia bacterium]